MLDKLLNFLKGLIGVGKEKLAQDNDPVKKAEQQIQVLKSDYLESLKYLAEVKAMYVRQKREYEQQIALAANYEQRAKLLLQKASQGEISSTQADTLALNELTKKEQTLKKANADLSKIDYQKGIVKKLEEGTQKLKDQIGEWERELKSLQARAKISEATQKMHQRLSSFGDSNTNSLLDEMRLKVDEQEALTDAYASLNSSPKSKLDEEVDKILGNELNEKAVNSLSQLKGEVKMESLPPKNENIDGQILADFEKLKKSLRTDNP
ncbi:MAG: PspA/IM30 family protein [Bacteroidetes bacterium]|nr:MAG: PspA/IM30 family protein [Bacteroidota bacterium]